MSVNNNTNDALISRLASIDEIYPECYEDFRETRLTRTETLMIKASAAIRETPGWEDELDNEASVQRWKMMATAEYSLSDLAATYVLDELRYYARLNSASRPSGCEISTVDMVWVAQLDGADGQLLHDLKMDVATVLECDDEHQDWSDSIAPMTSRVADSGFKPVLHLIDPSLHVLVYDRTPIFNEPTSSPEDALAGSLGWSVPGSKAAWYTAVHGINKNASAGRQSTISYYSERPEAHNSLPYCWIPSDIYVDNDGSVTIQSYINNLHPIRHKRIYHVISRMISRCIPLVEQVLTDIVHRRDFRVSNVFSRWIQETVPTFSYDIRELRYHEADTNEDVYGAWESGLRFVTPNPDKFVNPRRTLAPYSLRGRKLQAYVKMTNVYLTPENPEFIPEAQYIAGSENERILAAAICFYDMTNIQPVNIEFGDSVVKEPGDFDMRDYFVEHIYGPANFNLQGYSNELGAVSAGDGSFLCFPFFYECSIGPIRLTNPASSGHAKMLMLYFADPSQDVISTAVVPPQQHHWRLSTQIVKRSLCQFVPEDIQLMIAKHLDYSMGLDAAKDIRSEINHAHNFNNDSTNWYHCLAIGYNHGTRRFKK